MLRALPRSPIRLSTNLERLLGAAVCSVYTPYSHAGSASITPGEALVRTQKPKSAAESPAITLVAPYSAHRISGSLQVVLSRVPRLKTTPLSGRISAGTPDRT